jgi:hypothetical protein
MINRTTWGALCALSKKLSDMPRDGERDDGIPTEDVVVMATSPVLGADREVAIFGDREAIPVGAVQDECFKGNVWALYEEDEELVFHWRSASSGAHIVALHLEGAWRLVLFDGHKPSSYEGLCREAKEAGGD